MKVKNIYHGFQSEGAQCGEQTIFVNFVPCGFKCKSCETNEKKSIEMSVEEVIDKIGDYSANYVCLIGGEPLFWKDTINLIDKLIFLGYKLNLNTHCTEIIPNNYFFDKRVRISIDVPLPCSDKLESFEGTNLKDIGKKDELKFFIKNSEDYFYAVNLLDEFIYKKHPHDRPQIFFYPADIMDTGWLMRQIADDKLDVRLGNLGLGGHRSCK